MTNETEQTVTLVFEDENGLPHPTFIGKKYYDALKVEAARRNTTIEALIAMFLEMEKAEEEFPDMPPPSIQ